MEFVRQGGTSLIGTTIHGRYVLDSKLGEGGFGAVYRATHLQMGTDVALKIMHPELTASPNAAKRFALEARRSAMLRHPNTISVFDFGETERGQLFLAMEYLEGATLATTLEREGPMEAARVVHIVDQILQALTAAHAHDLVHRDLKPDNIFLTTVGDDRNFVKVLDFGIAKAAHQSGEFTATGALLGTPAYMSPEQCAGKNVDGRSDLYALGCMAFAMLAGRPPFQSSTPLGYLLAHTQEVPPDIANFATAQRPIPAALARFVTRMLAKAPEDRFATPDYARSALRSSLSGSLTWQGLSRGPEMLSSGSSGDVLVEGLQRPNAHVSRESQRPASGESSALGSRLGVTGERQVTGERDRRDEAVRTVSREAVGVSMSAPTMGAMLDITTGNIGARSAKRSDVLAPRRSRGGLWAVIAVLVVAAGAGLWALSDGAGAAFEPAAIDAESVAKVAAVKPSAAATLATTKPAESAGTALIPGTGAASANAPTDAAIVSELAKVEISSIPPGALVKVDGQDLGAAPQTVSWKRAVAAPSVELVLDGYVTRAVAIDLGDDAKTRTVALAKTEVVVPEVVVPEVVVPEVVVPEVVVPEVVKAPEVEAKPPAPGRKPPGTKPKNPGAPKPRFEKID